jgi:uncharacterized protein with HEPN domain
MHRDPRAFLWDVREAATQIQDFVAGMDASTYAANAMAQAAVERKFEVIGEALNQLTKLDAAMATRITDLPRIVAFRNQLIHGYASVNVSTVWTVAQTALPLLLAETNALLDELGPA